MESLSKYLREPERPEKAHNGVWYEDRKMDRVLVFVHGVLSDSSTCWYQPGSADRPGVYWPDLLKRDAEFATYSIYLGGYDTSLESQDFGVAQCSEQLFGDLTRRESPHHKSVLEHSAIVFVCHSTGGIVVRYMLDNQTKAFQDKTIGLVLIASPSYGSRWASSLPLRFLAKLYKHDVAKELRWSSPILRDLDGRFRRLVYEKRIPRLSGIEACENKFVFQRRWLPPYEKVVNKESAGRYFGFTRILPGTDHFTAVKPTDCDHPSYKLLRDFCYSFETSVSALIPLENFDAIYREAIKLLIWVGDEARSEFIMTSATPVFGIELDQAAWTSALSHRLKSASKDLKTELFCLNPLSFNSDSAESLNDSPLWKFCLELDEGRILNTSEAQNASDLYLRSIKAFLDFAELADKSQDIQMRCGPQPPFHFAMAKDSSGQYKGILYFTGVQSAEGLVVKGFVTQESTWIHLMRLLYLFLKKDRPDILKELKRDPRSEKQKQRCLDLLRHQVTNRETYDAKVGKYKVTVHPDVFPPDKGTLTSELLDAIAKVAKAMETAYGEGSFVGVDVGTGTGILALALADYCKKVYATDISKIARDNALDNISKHKAENIWVTQGDLLDGIPDSIDASPIIAVFNYPFYSSPLAVFNPKGKNTAGLELVSEFLDKMSNRFKSNDSVVTIIPCSHLADGDPKPVAAQHNLKSIDVVQNASGDRVYAFTGSKTIIAALDKVLGRIV